MKINLHILLLGILLVSALYSCNNEDDLVSPRKKNNRFRLPQGDHDFDRTRSWNGITITELPSSTGSPTQTSITISPPVVMMLSMT